MHKQQQRPAREGVFILGNPAEKCTPTGGSGPPADSPSPCCLYPDLLYLSLTLLLQDLRIFFFFASAKGHPKGHSLHFQNPFGDHQGLSKEVWDSALLWRQCPQPWIHLWGIFSPAGSGAEPPAGNPVLGSGLSPLQPGFRPLGCVVAPAPGCTLADDSSVP